MPRKKKPEKLPKHVSIKKENWFVTLSFPTDARSADNKIVYDQCARRCDPETAARAIEVTAEITAFYLKEKSKTSGSQTVNSYLETFLAAKKRAVSRRTFEFYSEQFDRVLKKSEFGRRVLESVKPLDVQSFLDGLGKQGASADAVRKLNQFLSAAFAQAVRWETILKNPVKGVILPKKAVPKTAAFSRDEIKRFLTGCRTDDRYIVFELAFETAARPEEYLALTWDDIDMKSRTVRIHRAVTFGLKGGGFEFGETKTPASIRTVAFSVDLASRLEMHRANRKKGIEKLKPVLKKPLLLNHMKKKGVLYQERVRRNLAAKRTLANFAEYNLVFPSATGLPNSRLNLNRRDFKDVLRLAGLDARKFSLYSLRRTAATLLAAKINPKELSAFMGHSDVTTTMKYYVMITEDSKNVVAEAFSEIFDR